jgi:phenylacetate-CoA ligase
MAEDRMTLLAELRCEAPEGLAERVAQTVRDITKLRAAVAWKQPGDLPNDGKVIEDARSYR